LHLIRSVLVWLTEKQGNTDMANFKYFADTAAGTLVFTDVDYISRNNIRGYDADTKRWVQVTRTIQIKSNPTRHECDDRCMNATGRTMQCECKCGGKNHGRGSFVCAEAA
jgi:hypothetical protein